MPHGEEEPGDHGPAAGDVDPLLAGVAHHERAEGEGEGHAESDVAEVEHRRVDDHLGILQQRIEAVAVGGNDAAGDEREGRGRDVDQQQEEDLDAGEDGRGVGGELDVDFVADAEDESVSGEEKGPQQQGALLAGPERGELVGGGEGAVGVLGDVGDGEVVGEGGPDEGEGGAGGGKEAGDAGAACGFGEALGGDGIAAAGGELAEGDSSGQQVIAAESERDEERKGAKCRHRRRLSDCRTFGQRVTDAATRDEIDLRVRGGGGM